MFRNIRPIIMERWAWMAPLSTWLRIMWAATTSIYYAPVDNLEPDWWVEKMRPVHVISLPVWRKLLDVCLMLSMTQCWTFWWLGLWWEWCLSGYTDRSLAVRHSSKCADFWRLQNPRTAAQCSFSVATADVSNCKSACCETSSSGPSLVKALESEADFERLVKESDKVVCKFTATWVLCSFGWASLVVGFCVSCRGVTVLPRLNV